MPGRIDFAPRRCGLRPRQRPRRASWPMHRGRRPMPRRIAFSEGEVKRVFGKSRWRPQILTDGRAKRGEAHWGEERADAIRASWLWVSPWLIAFFPSVSICENLWTGSFSSLSLFSRRVAASPRWAICGDSGRGRSRKNVAGEWGGRGMGIRDEKAEEVRQNDGGRMMKMGNAGGERERRREVAAGAAEVGRVWQGNGGQGNGNQRGKGRRGQAK